MHWQTFFFPPVPPCPLDHHRLRLTSFVGKAFSLPPMQRHTRPQLGASPAPPPFFAPSPACRDLTVFFPLRIHHRGRYTFPTFFYKQNFPIAGAYAPVTKQSSLSYPPFFFSIHLLFFKEVLVLCPRLDPFDTRVVFRWQRLLAPSVFMPNFLRYLLFFSFPKFGSGISCLPLFFFCTNFFCSPRTFAVFKGKVFCYFFPPGL